jgi:hypothetical protein
MKKEQQTIQEELASIFIESQKAEGKFNENIDADKLKRLLSSDVTTLEELQKVISS